MAPRHMPTRDGGFTLVELVAAMFVIGMILTLIIGIQLQAQVTIKDARLRQQATALANEAMEEMRAVPWRVLTKGMHADFVAASGETRVAGGTLTIDGESFPLIMAPAGMSGQDLTQPWRPLFDSTGSNKQVRLDPGLTGTEFTVRSYVTRPEGAAATDGVGLVVIVEWTDARGTARHTVVSSPAYASLGCGGIDLSPFAGACQAILSAAASTGTINSSVTAWSGIAGDTGALPVVPGSSAYSFNIQSATVSATSNSVQSVRTNGTVTFGRSTVASDPLVEPMTTETLGIAPLVLAASTDPQIPGAIPANPTPLTNVIAAANAEQVKSLSGDGLTLFGRSDYRRPASLTSSSVVSCLAGIPAKAPCAFAALANRNPDSFGEASAPITLNLNGTTVQYVGKVTASSHNTEQAYAARFLTQAGSTAVGCTALSGPGCTSAGASRDIGTIRFGTVSSGTWSGGATTLVEITNLKDSVLVQRGASQKATPATVTRSGTLRYWDGTSTQTVTFTKDTTFTAAIGPATYVAADPGYWIEVVSGSVSIAAADEPAVNNEDAACLETACSVYANSGIITVQYQVVVHTPSNPAGFAQNVSTSINPVSATASFKDYQP